MEGGIKPTHLELHLPARLIIEVNGVLRPEVEQEDEVNLLARDELRVPRLESASRNAEGGDLFRDGDDKVEFGETGEAGAEAGVDKVLEIAVRRRCRTHRRQHCGEAE